MNQFTSSWMTEYNAKRSLTHRTHQEPMESSKPVKKTVKVYPERSESLLEASFDHNRELRLSRGTRFLVPGLPIAKPRQTRSDKWKKRPCVMKYRDFADRVREWVKLEEPLVAGMNLVFHIPIKDSWSKKKKAELVGKPHRQKPDVDNFLKSIMDALLKEDSMVWSVQVEKYWCAPGDEMVEVNVFY